MVLVTSVLESQINETLKEKNSFVGITTDQRFVFRFHMIEDANIFTDLLPDVSLFAYTSFFKNLMLILVSWLDPQISCQLRPPMSSSPTAFPRSLKMTAWMVTSTVAPPTFVPAIVVEEVEQWEWMGAKGLDLKCRKSIMHDIWFRL